MAKFHMKKSEGSEKTISLESHSDADFAADKDDRKSLTGGVICLNGMAVSWLCKKQGGVSLSTVEAEFFSASHMARELLGTRELLNELQLPVAEPMKMHMDSQSAIAQIEGEATQIKAKHIHV